MSVYKRSGWILTRNTRVRRLKNASCWSWPRCAFHLLLFSDVIVGCFFFENETLRYKGIFCNFRDYRLLYRSAEQHQMISSIVMNNLKNTLLHACYIMGFYAGLHFRVIYGWCPLRSLFEYEKKILFKSRIILYNGIVLLHVLASA